MRTVRQETAVHECATQTMLLCPACGYDVARTLADGIDLCPECGGEVSEAACLASCVSTNRALEVGRYLGACFAVTLVTTLLVVALGPTGLGRFSPALSVLGVLIGYLGGTVCLLGWPTGAGWVAERVVRPGDPIASFAVFVAIVVGGGMMLAGGLATGMAVVWWL
ncbi:MAG: hypothetical protein Tsb0013_04550 [Phycisphaerales bacterium]